MGGNYVIGIIVLIWWIRRKGPERATIQVDQGAQDRGIAALRARDPDFDPAAFVERTRATVAKVNDAWLAGAMGPARRLISDGVYVRFQTQLGLLKQDGLRNVMVDWKVVSADILAAEGDSQWTFFPGNYQEYEEDKKKRLGADSLIPRRIKYRPLTRT